MSLIRWRLKGLAGWGRPVFIKEHWNLHTCMRLSFKRFTSEESSYSDHAAVQCVLVLLLFYILFL